MYMWAPTDLAVRSERTTRYMAFLFISSIRRSLRFIPYKVSTDNKLIMYT